MARTRKHYRTQQINLEEGQQLRITAGTRTVFVWVNKRGLHFHKGGYAKSRKNQDAAAPLPKSDAQEET